jgi:hypothetical protein
MTQPPWIAPLTALLGQPDHEPVSGAELVVVDPDGTEQHRSALARHYRHQPGDPPTLWIRPLNNGYTPPARAAGEPGHRFSLTETRRRGLTYRTADVVDDEIRLELRSGQLATIRTLRSDLEHQLRAWDLFVTTVLPADIEAELDRLDDDNWYGPWA